MDGVQAVFAYGTLRGDFSESGDRWGVISRTGAAWLPASVSGFKLFQEETAFYPFALQTKLSEDCTLLVWPCDNARDAIAACDRIEGFEPKSPEDGLYRRTVVDVPASRLHFSGPRCQQMF
ncbi:unnamed protein product [Effrenium voratum]|nr:unnamed protein product [Effrenium voratum]